MTAVQDKIKISLDTDGNLLSGDKNKQGAQIETLTKEMATLKDQAKTLQVEINDIKERKDKGDSSVVSTVKSEHIKVLEDQLKAIDEKTEKIVVQVKDLEEFKK